MIRIRKAWKIWTAIALTTIVGAILYVAGITGPNHRDQSRIVMFVTGEAILKVVAISLIVATIKVVLSNIKTHYTGKGGFVEMHIGLRVVLAIAACIGIYIVHGVIMYGIFGFSSKDQDGIVFPCSIILMLALMGYVFKAIVSPKSKSTPSNEPKQDASPPSTVEIQTNKPLAIRGNHDKPNRRTPQIVIVALVCLTAIIVAGIICYGLMNMAHKNKDSQASDKTTFSIGSEIKVLKDGTWWRKMTKGEIESAKRIPFEDENIPEVDEKTLPYPPE